MYLIAGVKEGLPIAVLNGHEVVFPHDKPGGPWRLSGSWYPAAALEKARELTAGAGAASFTFVAYGAEIPMQVALTQGPTGDVATFTWSCSAAARGLVEAGFLSDLESGEHLYIRTPYDFPGVVVPEHAYSPRQSWFRRWLRKFA
jgi:hypothetical protein